MAEQVDCPSPFRQHPFVIEFKAIAAMSLNRVIGAAGKIPWHLPEDFKWFKQMTTGHVLVMGRKTFDSIGKPLPGRTTIVLTRASQPIPGVLTLSDFSQLQQEATRFGDRQVFICGGAEIYRLALPFCSDLYLTLVKRVVEGDTFFPPFEDKFVLEREVSDSPDFKIMHYRQAKSLTPGKPE